MAEHLTVLSLPYSRPTTPGINNAPVQIGFVGIGSMGYYMARNLAKRSTSPVLPSLPLKVWNRSPEKALKLKKELGKELIAVAESIEEIATSCDIIFSNLANDDIVKNIFLEPNVYHIPFKLSPPTKNKIFVETGTILPRLAGELDHLISGLAHSHFICCPVFGRPAVADKAQLVLVMAGEYRSKKEVAYLVVPAVGRKVIDLGENVEKGETQSSHVLPALKALAAPTFKLLGNSMILGAMEVVAEAYTLGDKAGIEAERVNELVGDILPAPSLMGYAERMAHDDYNGVDGFSLDGGIKDASQVSFLECSKYPSLIDFLFSHLRRLTAQYNVPMPVIDIAHQHLITARAIHSSQKEEGLQTLDILDWSALIAGSRVAAGLDPFNSRKKKAVVEEIDDA
ncbi:hypothetical protein D9757_010838 [Collybiopsis confluens]|uniref:6-phosphogluconate dehydrogenase NADP-binding domain-containing protein n=1 Tax=Collybiopsis confluens TaxID=2823264 RepID=A0A8H5GKZ8_9AGAR|nr:hypothetical protein D9757_010838 [Collybiopsis confluens]